MKVFLITGGIHSGCGKGVLASLMCHLFPEGQGAVSYIKLDPYWNVCAGTLGPAEHGEVYVLDSDGAFEGAAQVDLDFGNVERLGGVRNMTGDHNITMGKAVVRTREKEQRGDYRGQTIRMTPHISGTIVELIRVVMDKLAGAADSLVIELGGTVGDDEHKPFVHALRQLMAAPDVDGCLVHFVPILEVGHDGKTKPAQHSLDKLWRPPDVIVGRLMTRSLTTNFQRHAKHFTKRMRETCPEVGADRVAVMPTLERLTDLKHWAEAVLGPILWPGRPARRPADAVPEAVGAPTIAIYGKYAEATDSYASVVAALRTACPEAKITQLSVADPDTGQPLSSVFHSGIHGVVIPGGFGTRGFLGKVAAAKHCISQGIPLLGICMGFQAIAVALLQDTPHARDRRLSDELEDAPVSESAGKDTHEAAPPALVQYMDVGRSGGRRSMLLGQYLTKVTPDDDTDFEHLMRFYSGMPRFRNRLGLAFEDGLAAGGKNITHITYAGRVWVAAMSDDAWFATQYHCEFSVKDNFPEFRWLASKARARRQLSAEAGCGPSATLPVSEVAHQRGILELSAM